MVRPGWLLTAMAVVAAAVTAAFLRVTATAAEVAVTPLVLLGAVLLGGMLLVGSARWIGVSSVPMVGAMALESGFGQDPSWVRSLAAGCLWYLTLELGWEAIDRRDGARHTPAAQRQRLQEVVAVLGLSICAGGVAILAAAGAPTRSVAVQAITIGAVFAVIVVLLRRLTGLGTPAR